MSLQRAIGYAFLVTVVAGGFVDSCAAQVASTFSDVSGVSDPYSELPILPPGEWRHDEWDDASLAALLEEPAGKISPFQLAAAGAGSSGGGGASAGQQSQNPIADLATLPIQSNWNFGNGPYDRTQYVGLLQPVIPLKLTPRLNLITRPILPLINSPFDQFSNEHGLGDMQWQNFFVPVPACPSKWTWGVGPSFILPTASDEQLGLQRWGAGVSGVVVYAGGPIVSGALINQNYVESGVSKPFLLQPFFNYNFSKGILKNSFFAASGEFQADWEADEDRRWLNVLGIGPGRIMNVFGQPITVVTRFAPYLAAPDGGPDWQFRFQLNLLFPK